MFQKKITTNKMKKLILLLLTATVCFTVSAENVTNEYCSFRVPDNLELQQGFLADLKGELFESESLYEATLQQKGLNAASEPQGYNADSDAFNDYCRITISCSIGSGVFGYWDSVDMNSLDKYMYESFSSMFSIAKWNGIKKVAFKGYDALVVDYIRESTAGNEDVHVYNLSVSTEAYDWNIVFAVRESSLNKYIPSFKEFGESFEFGIKAKTASRTRTTERKTYSIPGTAQTFIWYRAPEWQTEYEDGISYTFFADESYDADGYMTISITVMDLTGLITGEVGKLGFLFGAERQVPAMISSMFQNFNLKVNKNSVDSKKKTYTYRYSYSDFGVNTEGIILYSFSGSNCVLYNATWNATRADSLKIIDSYIDVISR